MAQQTRSTVEVDGLTFTQTTTEVLHRSDVEGPRVRQVVTVEVRDAAGLLVRTEQHDVWNDGGRTWVVTR